MDIKTFIRQQRRRLLLMGCCFALAACCRLGGAWATSLHDAYLMGYMDALGFVSAGFGCVYLIRTGWTSARWLDEDTAARWARSGRPRR